jgi:tripartite-type tricarboxylate transporter receptor subunit TctC
MKLKFAWILLPIITLFQLPMAYAQNAYPDRPVRLIVPQAAGGPSDVLGRVVAQKLSDSLGKSVIVDNKPGAGGNIGTDNLAKAKPDGYTMLITIIGILGINETLYKTLPFNISKDLDGISKVASSPHGVSC